MKINLKFRRLTGIMSALAFASGGTVAFAATEQGTSEATLLAPLTLTNTQNLDFGTIIPSAAVGRVTINARTGARTSNANATLTGNDGSRALFTATGQGNTGITLSSSATTIILTGPGGATMSVDRLRVNRNNSGQQTMPRNYNIPASGSMNIGFGGRLRVGPNQAGGLYSGIFDLTMEYQ